MKNCLLVSLALLLLPLASLVSAADSFIYQGTYSRSDLILGTKTTYTAYLVLGDEMTTTDGFEVIATLVIYSKNYRGTKKVAFKSNFGNFRGIRVETPSGKKEVLVQGKAMFDVDKAHSADTTYLVGKIVGSKYGSPLFLIGLGAAAGGDNTSNPGSATAIQTKLVMNLVPNVTDAAVAAGDTWQESVQRVVTLLQNKGYKF